LPAASREIFGREERRYVADEAELTIAVMVGDIQSHAYVCFGTTS
jgi:hypothetical protein